MLSFAQQDDVGGQWVGVDATPTGTAGTNDVVVDFTGSTQTLFAAPSIPVPVVAVHSQTLGSTFKIAVEGMWFVHARLACQGAGACAIGLGLDNIAAELNTDPLAPIGTRIIDNDLRAGQAAPSFSGVTVISGPQAITRDMAEDPTRAIFRLLASNAVGAGVAAATLVLPVGFIKFKRIGDLPWRYRR